MNFYKLVEEMRQVQKEYFALVTSKNAPFKRDEISRLLTRCKKLEAEVDRALVQIKDQARQMALFDLRKKTDEPRGAYNVIQDGEAEEESAA